MDIWQNVPATITKLRHVTNFNSLDTLINWWAKELHHMLVISSLQAEYMDIEYYYEIGFIGGMSFNKKLSWCWQQARRV